MLVECTREFLDMAENTRRTVGERWEVDEARYGEINSTRFGQLVEAVETEPESEPEPEREPEEAAKPKRRTARKKADEE